MVFSRRPGGSFWRDCGLSPSRAGQTAQSRACEEPTPNVTFYRSRLRPTAGFGASDGWRTETREIGRGWQRAVSFTALIKRLRAGGPGLVPVGVVQIRRRSLRRRSGRTATRSSGSSTVCLASSRAGTAPPAADPSPVSRLIRFSRSSFELPGLETSGPPEAQPDRGSSVVHGRSLLRSVTRMRTDSPSLT